MPILYIHIFRIYAHIQNIYKHIQNTYINISRIRVHIYRIWMLTHFSHVDSVNLWTVALLAPLSMGFSSKNTRVGCHNLLQGIFPIQGLNLYLFSLLHWQVGFLSLAPPGRSYISWIYVFWMYIYTYTYMTYTDILNICISSIYTHPEYVYTYQEYIYRFPEYTHIQKIYTYSEYAYIPGIYMYPEYIYTYPEYIYTYQ